MLRHPLFRFVILLFIVTGATVSRGEAKAVICSNVGSLNAQFISLMGEHLGFEPHVLLNPDHSQVSSETEIGMVHVVVSGSEYDVALECADDLGIDKDRLEQEILELRARLGKPGDSVNPGLPSGKIWSTGRAVEISGKRLFVRVTDDKELMSAGAAVADAHGVRTQACWFAAACLAAAEAHWSDAAE